MRSRFILAVLAGMVTIAAVGGILYGVIFAGRSGWYGAGGADH